MRERDDTGNTVIIINEETHSNIREAWDGCLGDERFYVVERRLQSGGTIGFGWERIFILEENYYNNLDNLKKFIDEKRNARYDINALYMHSRVLETMIKQEKKEGHVIMRELYDKYRIKIRVFSGGEVDKFLGEGVKEISLLDIDSMGSPIDGWDLDEDFHKID